VKNNQLPATTADLRNKEAAEVHNLVERLNSEHPKPEDVENLRRLAVQEPALLSAFSTTESIRQQIIEKNINGNSRAIMLAEMDVLKKQLGDEAAPPLERLLIDLILTLHLRVNHAEKGYNASALNQSVTFIEAEYRDKLLSSTQARYLKAIETLARVRRLGRNTPALQINIAHDVGQQVNAQGDVNGQNAK
jgi:hypothetical protein